MLHGYDQEDDMGFFACFQAPPDRRVREHIAAIRADIAAVRRDISSWNQHLASTKDGVVVIVADGAEARPGVAKWAPKINSMQALHDAGL